MKREVLASEKEEEDEMGEGRGALKKQKGDHQEVEGDAEEVDDGRTVLLRDVPVGVWGHR